MHLKIKLNKQTEASWRVYWMSNKLKFLFSQSFKKKISIMDFFRWCHCISDTTLQTTKRGDRGSILQKSTNWILGLTLLSQLVWEGRGLKSLLLYSFIWRPRGSSNNGRDLHLNFFLEISLILKQNGKKILTSHDRFLIVWLNFCQSVEFQICDSTQLWYTTSPKYQSYVAVHQKFY